MYTTPRDYGHATMNTSIVRRLAICIAAMSLFSGATPAVADERRQVKVVIVAMYEVGAPRGDARGELQFWVERLKLDTQLDFPAGESDLFLGALDGALAEQEAAS